ncbi:MAG: tetratricopeptide repeat protein [Alphaproteobacteria bacterium]|nr:tetratricopeptide repeat protein [Alphaproteobacteria bacterium]
MQNALVEKLNQARLLKRHFKLDETVDVLKECLELDPSCLIAAAQAGLCLLMLGKPTEAKPFLKKTFEESQQKDLLVGSYLAACLTALGKENQANEILSDIQNDEFSIAETYMLTAEMMCEKKQYEAAVRLIDGLSVHFSQDLFFSRPINHYRMIRVLAHAGLTDIAKQLAEALSENAPESWETLASNASVAIAEEKYEEAYSLTVKALKKGGSSYPLLAAQQHWLAMNK